MNKKCSKINITDIMNLLAVTVTLSIQTCIVRLYNVKKKNSQHNMYSQKKLNRSILVFQGNSTFFFSLSCSAKATKMNVLVLRHSNIMSNVATLINLIVILKRG